MSLLEDSANWPDFEQATGEVCDDHFELLDYRVARISPNYVAKFPRSWDFLIGLEKKYLEELEREFNITSEVHKAGIHVPEPKGMFTVTRNNGFGLPQIIPAFVMRYVVGRTVQSFGLCDGDLRLAVQELWQAEIAKAKKLGFVTNDTEGRNAIYSPVENKVYLIDLEGWKRR